MSEQDKDRKTEKPTPRRLRQLREKGQIPRSQEVVSGILMLVIFLYLWFSWDLQFQRLQALIQVPATFYGIAFDEALERLLERAAKDFFLLVSPFVLLILVAGILANGLQFGFIFSVDPVLPKFEKINPVKGFKRIFSLKNMFETVRAIIKTGLLSAIVYWVISANLADLLKLPYCNLHCVPPLTSHLTWKIAAWTAPVLLVLGAIDFLFQRYIYLRDHKMTREEAKKDHKESEGDPLIKGRRKEIHQEIIQDDSLRRISEATVILTGAHGLVGVKYQQGVTPLPVIVGIGRGPAMTGKLLAMARRRKIPLVRDEALATGLINRATAGQPVPRQYLAAVAAILRPDPAV